MWEIQRQKEQNQKSLNCNGDVHTIVEVRLSSWNSDVPALSARLQSPNSDSYTHSVHFLKSKLEEKIPRCDRAQSFMCQQQAPA